MKENKDLPAFGHCAMTDNNGFQEPRLTKREYFAAMAMQGILSSRGLQEALNADRIDWAKCAVSQADALLSELEKTQTNELT